MLLLELPPSSDALLMLLKSPIGTAAIIQKKGILLAVQMIIIRLGHACVTSFSSAGSERLAASMSIGWPEAVSSILSCSHTSSPILMGGGGRQVAKARRLWCQTTWAWNSCFSTYCESLSKLL